MPVSTQTPGLVSCGLCQDSTKRYTHDGLAYHLRYVHKRDICPTCGADRENWRQELHEEHTCLGLERGGEGTIEVKRCSTNSQS